jgi:hypothetical protein
VVAVAASVGRAKERKRWSDSRGEERMFNFFRKKDRRDRSLPADVGGSGRGGGFNTLKPGRGGEKPPIKLCLSTLRSNVVVLWALNFNGGKFLCIIFWVHNGWISQRGTFKLVDLN